MNVPVRRINISSRQTRVTFSTKHVNLCNYLVKSQITTVSRTVEDFLNAGFRWLDDEPCRIQCVFVNDRILPLDTALTFRYGLVLTY